MTPTRTSRASRRRSTSRSRRTATRSARRASRSSPIRSRRRRSSPSSTSTPSRSRRALLHDVPEDTEYALSDIEERFGSEVAPARRRRDQARQVLDRLARAAAGREHPEDVPGDGGGHPRRPHQARRPPAQHADPRRPGAGEAAADRAPDARDLRAARRAPRDLADQVGARGPGVQDPRAGAVPRARQAARHPAQGRASRSSTGRSPSWSRG